MISPPDKTPDGSSTPEGEPIAFHYIKSNFFRVVHADGAHGGITPRGLVEMNFFSERHPIPKKVVHTLLPTGQMGPEVREERVERDGPVREVDVGVIMDLAAAKSLHAWLAEKIEVLTKLQPERQP